MAHRLLSVINVNINTMRYTYMLRDTNKVMFIYYKQKKMFPDVLHVILAYPLGILRKMVCYFVKTTTGLLTARHVKAVVKSSLVLSCWREITNFTQNVLLVLLAALLSGMARVMRWSNAPNCIAGFAINDRCNLSTGQQTIHSPGSPTVSD